jgi:hypothetical protein
MPGVIGGIDDWKIARIYFLTLASILFQGIHSRDERCCNKNLLKTLIGGKSVLEGKSTIFQIWLISMQATTM